MQTSTNPQKFPRDLHGGWQTTPVYFPACAPPAVVHRTDVVSPRANPFSKDEKATIMLVIIVRMVIVVLVVNDLDCCGVPSCHAIGGARCWLPRHGTPGA